MRGVYIGDFPYSAFVTYKGMNKEYMIEGFLSGKVKVRHNGEAVPLVHILPQLVSPDEEPLTDSHIALDGRECDDDNCWFVNDNPRIRLDDGSTIWGMECYWRTLDDDEPVDMVAEKQNLDEHFTFLRSVFINAMKHDDEKAVINDK